MRINILTSVGNKGGPFKWAKGLVHLLRKRNINAYHIYLLKDLLTSPIYQDADIIHTTLPLAYRLWRKPVVLTIKGDYTIEDRTWRYLYPIAIKKADVITTPSFFLKKRLNLDNAVVIPNAIFPEQFKMVEHLEKDVINAVSVTNFGFRDKAESVLNMIEILKKVKIATDKKINHIIIGGGAYLKQVKEKARECDTNVNFTGFLGNPKEVLEDSDIFMYYSVHDNFPNSILEAMASGLPIITNKIGAVNEIISNSKDGYVTYGDDEYQECLLNLLDDYKLRAQIGANARKTVEEKFNWNRVIQEYLNIYKKCGRIR